MMGLGRSSRNASSYVPDTSDLYEQLDTLRGYVQELTHGLGKGARGTYGSARDYAADTAHDAEELMHDNLAASMVLAVGVGVLIGYFIRRGTE